MKKLCIFQQCRVSFSVYSWNPICVRPVTTGCTEDGAGHYPSNGNIEMRPRILREKKSGPGKGNPFWLIILGLHGTIWVG